MSEGRSINHQASKDKRDRSVLEQLKAIELGYGVDLNTAGKDNVRVMQGIWY